MKTSKSENRHWSYLGPFFPLTVKNRQILFIFAEISMILDFKTQVIDCGKFGFKGVVSARNLKFWPKNGPKLPFSIARGALMV